MSSTSSVLSKSQSTRELQKLQRALVNGLEDVKAKNIAVFDTEALSPLFERVAIATGGSSRQTKALAQSVSEAVREAGFPKPRIEGESNGEWIIVDCGAAVVHIMQEQVREYYQLESLWGDKPVRLSASKKATSKKTISKEVTTKASTKKAPAKTAAKASAAKPVTKKVAPAKAKTTAKVAEAKTTTKVAVKKAPAKPTAKKAGAKT